MEFEQTIDQYITYLKTKNESLYSAWEWFDRVVHNDPDIAWRSILTVLKKTNDKDVLANLAAGPLEDLLVYHGPTVIERLELEAKTNDQFNWLLGGVWKNNIEDDVWRRVTLVRKLTW